MNFINYSSPPLLEGTRERPFRLGTAKNSRLLRRLKRTAFSITCSELLLHPLHTHRHIARLGYEFTHVKIRIKIHNQRLIIFFWTTGHRRTLSGTSSHDPIGMVDELGASYARAHIHSMYVHKSTHT